MPNWCSNKLFVVGPKDEIDRFCEKAKGHGEVWPRNPSGELAPASPPNLPLDFNQFIPVPAEVLAVGYDGHKAHPGEVDGYHWCRENWGTKWSLCEDTTVERTSDRSIVYQFDTAWTPPQPVIRAMAEQFPALKFQLDYDEPGFAFAGRLVCEEGEESGSEQHKTCAEIYDEG